MHEKVHHLFAEKFKDKRTLDKGKERKPLLSLLFHKFPSDSLQCNFLYADIYKQHYQEL